MIYEVSGDILLSNTRVLAHGVAPNDNFGQGLALSLREMWPAMYKDFRHYCHMSHPKSGDLWIWAGADGKRIVNLLTQEGAYDHGAKPGRATLANVNHVLRKLHKTAEEENFPNLALPRIATGVGGLDWHDVFPLIKEHLGGLHIPIFVYSEFHAGVRADENI